MKITTTPSTKKLIDGCVSIRFDTVKTNRFKEFTDGATELVIALPEKGHTARTLRIAVRKIVDEARRHQIDTCAIHDTSLLLGDLDVTPEVFGELVAYNLHLASYTFTNYKTKHEQRPSTISVVTDDEQFVRGFKKGSVVGESVNEARSIANTPGGDMTPLLLAKSAQKALKGTGVTTRVLGKKDIEKLKMGAILGVSRGSNEEPRFIILEHKGGKKNEPPIVFVGKGITFDTGGLSMKPADAMLDMHLDMTGGATVIGALRAIGLLKLKRNVIGLIPSAENMVSGESYRPGDILTTMSGKTVDVLNTDAEGRLVLADALTYAERYKPKLVVDIATLTGASLVALGQHASALMTKDDDIALRIAELGEMSGDYVWRLPLWDEYIKYTKGTHADLANIQSFGNPRYGGAINGGAFLSHFATTYPWVHIDMAPRMTPAPGDHLSRGATGEPTALLIKIAEEYS